MRVVWTTPALLDLETIQDFLAVESPSAAHRLTNTIFERTQRLLSSNPMLGRTGRAPQTRELVIVHTPYIVVYRLSDQIEILAVVHGAREWPDDFDR